MRRHSGPALRDARERAKLTQVQVADALGVSQSAVAHWEAGRRHPADEDVARLVEFLEVDVNDAISAPAVEEWLAEIARAFGDRSATELRSWLNGPAPPERQAAFRRRGVDGPRQLATRAVRYLGEAVADPERLIEALGAELERPSLPSPLLGVALVAENGSTRVAVTDGLDPRSFAMVGLTLAGFLGFRDVDYGPQALYATSPVIESAPGFDGARWQRAHTVASILLST